MVLLPVFWLGLCGTRGSCGPVDRSGAGVRGSAESWSVAPTTPPARGGREYCSLTLSGIVGTTVQALVTHVRAQEHERNRLLAQLDELRHVDTLTGLANRRAWDSETQSRPSAGTTHRRACEHRSDRHRPVQGRQRCARPSGRRLPAQDGGSELDRGAAPRRCTRPHRWRRIRRSDAHSQPGRRGGCHQPSAWADAEALQLLHRTRHNGTEPSSRTT